MPDYLGDEQRKVREEEKEDKPIRGIIRHRKISNCVLALKQKLAF